MERYIVLRFDDNIIFKDKEKNIELSVKHYPEDYHTDVVIVDENYTEDFIEFIVKELTKTKDLFSLYVKTDSKSIEKRMENLGYKVSNYQYIISKDNCGSEASLEYDVSNILGEEEKDYFLKQINESTKKNHAYFRPNYEYSPYTETSDRWQYLTFRVNGEIVGIVNFEDFLPDDKEHEIDDIFLVSNRICIGGIFAQNEEIVVDIIKYLLHLYKKDVMVNFLYTEDMVKKGILLCNGKFMRTLFLFVE